MIKHSSWHGVGVNKGQHVNLFLLYRREARNLIPLNLALLCASLAIPNV